MENNIEFLMQTGYYCVECGAELQLAEERPDYIIKYCPKCHNEYTFKPLIEKRTCGHMVYLLISSIAAVILGYSIVICWLSAHIRF